MNSDEDRLKAGPHHYLNITGEKISRLSQRTEPTMASPGNQGSPGTRGTLARAASPAKAGTMGMPATAARAVNTGNLLTTATAPSRQVRGRVSCGQVPG